MRIVTAADVTLERAWDAVDLAQIPDATVRLHWTDQLACRLGRGITVRCYGH